MAIQLRRGAYENFDPQKMKPAEVGVVQSGDPTSADGKAVYVAIQSGDVKRMASLDELEDYNDQSEAILQQVQAQNTTIQQVYQRTNQRATEAEQAASDAEQLKADTQQLKADVQTLYNNAESAIQGYTATAEQSIASTLADAQSAIADAQQDGIDAVEQAYQQREADINAKVDQMIAVKTSAEAVATQAKNKADRLENELAEFATTVDRHTSAINNLDFTVDGMIHGWYVDVQKRLIFTDVDGNPIGEPIEGIGGSGGGGGGGGSITNAEMTASNSTGWISKSISAGDSISVRVTWSSVENNLPTGNGVATIKVNNIVKSTYEVPQGEIVIDLADLLGAGSNTVKVTITDIYDQSRTISFNISVLDLRITSNLDTSSPFDGPISVSFTPIGEVQKTISIEVDNIVVETVTTSVSNRQMTYIVPAQSHGAHTLRLYFDCEINNQSVRSNILYYEFMSVETLNNTPIITSPFNKSSVTQYDSVVIPYTVYDPVNATAPITLKVNNTTVAELSVDRSEQSYTFRANTAGATTFSIVCGNVTKTISFTVTELSIDVEAETDSLVLYLSAQGRSNNEATPETWTYGNISTTFSGFNGSNDRWQKDADGIDVCRVSGNARLSIGYQPCATDFRTSGKTIEFEFATRDILDYDATVISCMSGDRGFSFTAQQAILKSEQASIGTQYKEDEHVRIAFVVQKRVENRLLFIYINGICSGAVQYPDDDDFSQISPVNITVGSNYCTTDLYCIRIYDNDLTKEQVLNNWIADTQIGSDLLDRYNHNNVYDAYGNVVIAKLPSDLPYMIIACAELPQYKGDKKTCNITFTNPQYPSKSFTSNNVQIDVQGTSSQYYARKNYKTKHKNGFITSSGTSGTYAMNSSAIPTNSFCFKADVASSEGANNVELARLYNDTCPYSTPAQEENDNVRQGIDGFPMVIFWQDTTTDTISFLGKYNFNNDKGTEEVFGFESPDESIEIKNNTSTRVLWKSADYTGSDYLNDFEWRFPDTDPAYVDATQLSEFATWLVSTDTDAATNDALDSSVTYGGVTYTNDTAEYRLAKFKAEAGNYMEINSALFYYLFTELFLMVDSRAKNAFPSFIGSTIN